jgi:murein DD-endopeptidase MepM/ murein hydrolase activator NlpD
MRRSRIRNSASEALRVAGCALAIAFPLLLAACASSAPRDTNFDWNLESDGPAQSAHLARTDSQSASLDQEQTAQPGAYTPPADPQQKVVASALPSLGAAGGGQTFIWPVQGPILSDFGSQASGGRNDGINIGAPVGTPIHAAGDGVVAYAGSQLKSYGNLVLINHEGDYVTAYAHAQRLTVTRGQKVVKGQVIGYTGQTGDVEEPQVHFEIRRGTTPIDPHPLLVASR